MSYEDIEPDPGPLAYCPCGALEGSNFMLWTDDNRWVCRDCWRRDRSERRAA